MRQWFPYFIKYFSTCSYLRQYTIGLLNWKNIMKHQDNMTACFSICCNRRRATTYKICAYLNVKNLSFALNGERCLRIAPLTLNDICQLIHVIIFCNNVLRVCTIQAALSCFFSPLVRMMQVNACSVYVFGSKWRIASLNHHLLDNSFLRCICSHDLFVLTHIDPPTIITMVPFHGNALLVTYFSILDLVWLNLIYPHKLSLLMKCSFHLKLSLMLVLLLISLHLEQHEDLTYML